jgi:hypothetical protein
LRLLGAHVEAEARHGQLDSGFEMAGSDAADRSQERSYQHGLATFPDVREAQRSLAAARALEQAARAEAWTRDTALAVSTRDLAKP